MMEVCADLQRESMEVDLDRVEGEVAPLMVHRLSLCCPFDSSCWYRVPLEIGSECKKEGNCTD
jgi:hypothetical protein